MRTLYSILFVLTGLMTFAQQVPDSLASNTQEPGLNKEAIEASINKSKLSFGLEFGTSFGAGPYGSYFGTYVAPRFTYPLTSRFSVSAGGYFSGISPMSQGESPIFYGYPYGNMYSRSLIFVSGAYRLNENITLTGTAYKEINPFGSKTLYPGYSPESRGLIMGVHYKVSDHVFIHGEVEVSNGYRPYHSSPFMGPAGSGMHNPFFYGQ